MNKTAVITGASRGIGASIANALAALGYNLSICCHSSVDSLNELAQLLNKKYGVTVICFVGDVGDYSFAEHMINETVTQLGHIDVLINNAGISYIGLLGDMTIDEWNKIVSTNLTSVFSFSKLASNHMVSRGSGKIIQISSVWGNIGASCEVAYSACKGGINAFTRALGKELAPSNIQVNAVACGVIDTDMNKCFDADERLALEEDIPAGYFASPDAAADFVVSIINAPAYLNGQVITFDGGWT